MWHAFEDVLDMGLVVIDSLAKLKFANRKALNTLQWDREEIERSNLKDLILWPELENVLTTHVSLYGVITSLDRTKIEADYVYFPSPQGECYALAFFRTLANEEKVYLERDHFRELYGELQTIIDSAYDGFLIANGQGTILQVNKAYERIRGLSKQQVVGKSCDDLIAQGYYVISLVDEVLRKRDTVSAVLSPNNNHLLFTASPIVNESGEITYIVVNVRDMTELSDLRYQLQVEKEQSRRYRDQLKELRAKNLRTNGFIGNSPAMHQVLDLVLQVAQVDATLLITGESGVGKEVIAKLIHSRSPRCDRALIKVNCGAIPDNLIESELFGYEPGAFTGAAKSGKAGLFELADKGTLFLDEIGELALPLQVKLLRAIQEKEITRVGGVKTHRLDIRIIAATNKDLEEKVRRGEFREDLFFRLNVVPVHVPPVRERTADILPLLYHFRDIVNEKYHTKKEFSPDVVEFFLNYDWPGNVRELENLVERLIITSAGDLISKDDLPPKLTRYSNKPEIKIKGIMKLKLLLEMAEEQLINEALSRYKSPDKAAQVIGVNRATFFRKLRKLRQSGL